MLSYTRHGQGPALVLLHYFGGSGQIWRPVMELLAGQFDCLAPDLRGWGNSQSGYSSFTVDEMADDVQALLQSLGIESYALAGHSMGGKVAQVLAARGASGLSRLLLVAPSPLSPEPIGDEGRASMRAAWGSADKCRQMLSEITAHPLPETLRDMVINDNLCASEAAWTAWTDTGSREDLSARAAQIAVPTAVLAGEKDDPLSPAFLQAHVADVIGGAVLETVPDAGHLVPLEAPGACAAFLSAHGRE